MELYDALPGIKVRPNADSRLDLGYDDARARQRPHPLEPCEELQIQSKL